MVSYESSIHALQDLLLNPSSAERQNHGKTEQEKSYGVVEGHYESNNTSSSSYKCHITKIPEDISYLKNGVKYCFVEVTCNDGTQYGIQALGEEAVELYKKALKYLSQQEKDKKSPGHLQD
jgi:hypothetical protein